MDTRQIAAQNILADRRGRSELERDRRIREYHTKYPALKEIDTAIRICKAEMLLEIAENRGRLGDRSGLAGLELKKRMFLQDNRIPANYDRIIPYCSLCKDEGIVDGKPCSCYKELMIPALQAASGLDRYPGASFCKFSDEKFANPAKIRTIREVCEAYADKFPGQTMNLLFWGNPGTGKTFMAACLAKDVVNHAVSVLFIRISELLETMSEYRTQMLAFSQDEDRMPALKARRELIFHGGLLVIDDLGDEAKGPNTIADLLQILEMRLQQSLPTVITTNLSFQDIRRTYDDRLYSRLKGEFRAVNFEGNDIRTAPRSKQI